MPYVMAAMAVVVAVFLALALTDRPSVRRDHPALRRAVVVVWMGVVIGGWFVVGYLALFTAGGLDAAWEWVSVQTLALRVAMWLFLLPWMAALWIWQLPWPEWVRTVLVCTLAAATVLLSAQSGSEGPRSLTPPSARP